jgi:hypothetical protein
LTIQQVKSRLSPEIKQIYLPFKRSGELFNQSIQISKTPCNYGGYRYWFICLKCGKRVGVLYRHGVFVCRHCIGVNYQTQLQQPQDRLFKRLNALRERLGWYGGIVHGHGEKPKGMHQKTYNRLLSEYIELESIVSNNLILQFDQINKKLDNSLRELKINLDKVK